MQLRCGFSLDQIGEAFDLSEIKFAIFESALGELTRFREATVWEVCEKA